MRPSWTSARATAKSRAALAAAATGSPHRGVDVLVRENTLIPVSRSTAAHAAGATSVRRRGVHRRAAPLRAARWSCCGSAAGGTALVVIKDHSLEGFAAERTLRLMDWVGNHRYGVALPYNYLRPDQWNEAFELLDLRVQTRLRRLRLYPWPAIVPSSADAFMCWPGWMSGGLALNGSATRRVRRGCMPGKTLPGSRLRTRRSASSLDGCMRSARNRWSKDAYRILGIFLRARQRARGARTPRVHELCGVDLSPRLVRLYAGPGGCVAARLPLVAADSCTASQDVPIVQVACTICPMS